MKILQIGKFYPIRGGVEKVMYDIMQGISSVGISCDMLCAASTGHLPGDIVVNQYARIFCVPALYKLSATMISPSMVFRLRKLTGEYDIIHIHHPDPMAALALFLSGYKGKVVLHWHSDILKQRLLLKFYQPLQKWLIRRADVIVGTTPVYVEESPFLQKVQHKVTSIPIGIDPLRLVVGEAERIRQKYVGKKIIFSLGRLVGYKGFKYLIDAATLLDDNTVVLIGGKGPLKESLQKQVNSLGLQDKVILLGYLSSEQLSAYFSSADLYVLSSVQKTEAFAIVQIEAMSLGIPVVATIIEGSGVSWVNAHNISGLNVPSCDARALSAAIMKILSDPLLYRELSDGAMMRYHTMFRNDIMTEKCITLYNQLIDDK